MIVCGGERRNWESETMQTGDSGKGTAFELKYDRVRLVEGHVWLLPLEVPRFQTPKASPPIVVGSQVE
jgi:hypothetical protein